jgi:hypothetical protein
MLNNFLFRLYCFFKKNTFINQYYFFLPNIGHGFTSEIIITNYSQNSTKPENFINIFIALHIFDSNTNIWKLIDKVNFNKQGIAIISSKKYTKNQGDLVVASLHKANQILTNKSTYLPHSIIKKNDFSPHTVRCRLLFKKNRSFSSYMSEYPKKMTSIINGSAFSYGHLIAHQCNLAYTLILFVNISDKTSSADNAFMKLIDVNSGKIIFSNKIFPNKANICFIKNSKIKQKPLALVTQRLSGIPIFISEYKNILGKTRLSCEHSHPPSEYFFSNSLLSQTLLKKNWFKRFL